MNKQHEFTKRGSTHFLRAVVFGLGAVAIGLCILILPAIFREWSQAYPDVAYMRYPLLLIFSLTVIPFFVALFQTLKLLRYIDTGKAFSDTSVKALKVIKYCALAFGVLYAVALPAIYHVANRADAPGVMVIGLVMACAPIAIAVFAAVLQKLLQSAIDLKTENDLTV